MPRKDSHNKAPRGAPQDQQLGFLTIEDVGEDERDANQQAWDGLIEGMESEGELTLKVLRVLSENGNDVEVLFNAPPSDFPQIEKLEDYLRGIWGAGKYKVQFKVVNRIRKVVTFRLGQKPKEPVVVDPRANGDSDLLKYMMADKSQQHSLVLALIANMGRGNQGNGLEEFSKLMESSAKLMRNFRPDAGVGGGGLGDLAQLRDVIGMLDDIRGSGGEPHWVNDLAEKAQPLLQGIGQWLASRNGGQGRVIEGQVVAGQDPATAPAAPKVEVQPTGDPILEKLSPIVKTLAVGFAQQYKPFLDHLNGAAALRADPAAYVDPVLENLPEEVSVFGQKHEVTDDLLIQGLQRPDALDIVMAVYPAGVANREWFGQLMALVRAALEAERASGGEPKS